MASGNVFVVGPNTLQNELLASTLQAETEFSCSVFKNLAHIISALNKAEKKSCLALYDCLGRDGKTWLANLEKNVADKDLMVALFNLDRRAGLEKQAFSIGVKGFFYRGDPFTLFVKGVVAIFRGELWMSRRLLSELVTEKAMVSRTAPEHGLSRREKEILGLLARGATDKEIADAIFISRHTVKNHLCSIFKKINAHSKAQAAKWAARYLEI